MGSVEKRTTLRMGGRGALAKTPALIPQTSGELDRARGGLRLARIWGVRDLDLGTCQNPPVGVLRCQKSEVDIVSRSKLSLGA